MAIQKSIYEQLVIESNDQSKTVDIAQGAVSFDYYEDIFSPTITAKLRIVNVGTTVDNQSIYNGLPLRGGERVILKMAPNSVKSQNSLDFTTPERYLYVSSISDVISETNKESFTLNLVSREAITNETIRVTKKYPSSSRIDESVRSILEEYLEANKIKQLDETSNPYGFVGNSRKPFTILIWLSAKSVPAENGGSAGFVFYQTKEGFNFRSLDGLIQQESKATYTYSQGQESFDTQGGKVDNEFKILNYFVDSNQNMVEKLRLGAYSSQRMFFNPLNFTVTSPQEGQFTSDDYKKDVKTLGGKPKIPQTPSGSGTFGEIPSRIFTAILDVGTLDSEVSKDQSNSDPAKYQAQALMRYNLLMTQSLSMMIAHNPDLNAGDVMECKFPKVNPSDKGKEYDEEISGLYIIKELCHHFDAENSYTSLKLIRDTFGRQRK